jgi:hypothetical protein
MRRFLALLLLQGLRRYSKKQPSHVSLYLAFQLQYFGGRVKFLPLAWAGMPKTSFRKNSDSPLDHLQK